MTGHQRCTYYLPRFPDLWTLIALPGAVLLAGYLAFQVIWPRYLVEIALMLIMLASWITAMWMSAEMVIPGWVWSAPILIVAFSALLRRERASRKITLAATACRLVLSFCRHVVMTRSPRKEPTRATLCYTAFGVFAARAALYHGVSKPLRMTVMALFACVGGIGLIGLWLLDQAMVYTSLAKTAPLFLAQMPFSLALGSIVGHNDPDNRSLFHLAIIYVASAIPFFTIHSFFRVRVSQ